MKQKLSYMQYEIYIYKRLVIDTHLGDLQPAFELGLAGLIADDLPLGNLVIEFGDLVAADAVDFLTSPGDLGLARDDEVLGDFLILDFGVLLTVPASKFALDLVRLTPGERTDLPPANFDLGDVVLLTADRTVFMPLGPELTVESWLRSVLRTVNVGESVDAGEPASILSLNLGLCWFCSCAGVSGSDAK